MVESELQALADRLTVTGQLSDEPAPALAALAQVELSAADRRGLAGLLIGRHWYRVARALLEGLRGGQGTADAATASLQGPLDLVTVLCDLCYGTGRSTDEVGGGSGDGEDEAVTAVRNRHSEEFNLDEANTGRWAFKVPMAHVIGPSPAGGFLPAAFDSWFVGVADAVRAVHDAKTKLGRALLDGLTRAEPDRPEPIAALALLTLGEGNPAAGLVLVNEAQARLGSHPCLQRALAQLSPHLGAPPQGAVAWALVVEALMALLAAITIEQLAAAGPAR
jgi:hypothetical protein